MKLTFSTIDVKSVVAELKETILHLRVAQIYDVDHKTYLIKLQKPDVKKVLLLESGSRIHTTEYEWPKSPAPSGFSMKLRKHLRNKRIEAVEQLGVDRIVDFTFGSGDAANHLIVELYDRGNIALTDYEYTILNVLRPRSDEELKKNIVTHNKYPLDARQPKEIASIEHLKIYLQNAKPNAPLKKIFNPLLDCGGGVLEHELLESGFPAGAKLGKDLKVDEDLTKVHEALLRAQASCTTSINVKEQKGYVIKKIDKRSLGNGDFEEVSIFQEFHPRLFSQHHGLPHDVFNSFSQACDEFFSKMESIRLDQKAMQQQKEALKKLENVKKDHEKRLQDLQKKQEEDTHKGQLIELNKQLVEGALLVVRSAIANQIDWTQIRELLDEAQSRGDPVASTIRNLKLETNTITLLLSDPYDYEEDDLLLDSDEEREEGNISTKMRPLSIDIDLDLSALANARKYYNMKRQAAKKEQKTIDASAKAMKSAEKKTQKALKEVTAITNINKARKVHWFEKFLWFVSSENYLAIAGRDGQQNEIVVKRYLKPKDIYVHADLHGAASVVIKNPTGAAVPPRTLHEAGIMALCYSRAWDEKVVTSAWWVWGDQVSKTAPTGEYLTTGSFMVRGKKNFLPPSHLVYGFGFLFRLEESSIARHAGERKVRHQEDEVSSMISAALDTLNMTEDIQEEDEELALEDNEEEEVSESSELNKIVEEPEENLDDEESKLLEKEEESLENIKDDDSEEKGDEDEEDNSELKEEESEDIKEEFPDTVVEVSHLQGDQFTVRARTVSTTSQENTTSEGKDEDNNKGDSALLAAYKNKQQQGKKNRTRSSNSKSEKEIEKNDKPDKQVDNSGPLKRGQKGKKKKMKKYKDQDDEERELRMQLLQSSGNSKDKKKGKNSKKSVPYRGNKPVPRELRVPPVNIDSKPTSERDKGNENEEEEEEVNIGLDDINILNALTHIPYSDDELLYAIPVCAPYTSMTNYKFKVKLTPGPGKKGKACKTAINLFTSDKTTSSREKDLFRAVKDSDLSRNFPGKVKVSAPNILKMKK